MTHIAQALRETLERHADTVVLPPVTHRMVKRIRLRRLVVATVSMATVIAITLGGIGIASIGHSGRTMPALPVPSTSSDASGLYPPTFETASGWNTETTGVVQPYPASEDVPLAWAANVAFLDPFRDGTPERTLRRLPPDGVVILASQQYPETFPHRPGTVFTKASLPLRIADADVEHQWEGQAARNVPEYRLWRTVNGFWLDVRIYFGKQHPSRTVLEDAQQELDRLQLPAHGYSAEKTHRVLGSFSMSWPNDWYWRTHTTASGYQQLELSTASVGNVGPCAHTGGLRNLGPDSIYLFVYTKPHFAITGGDLSLYKQKLHHLELRPRAYDRYATGGVTCARTYWMLIPAGKHQEVMAFFAFGRDASGKLKQQALDALMTLHTRK